MLMKAREEKWNNMRTHETNDKCHISMESGKTDGHEYIDIRPQYANEIDVPI